MRFFAVLAYALVAQAGTPPPDLGAGKQMYVARCESCHGTAGKGDGPAAPALATPPPDMTTTAWWSGTNDDKIGSIVTGGKPGGIMRPSQMSSKDLANLVAYLHTFAPRAP